MPPRPNRTLSSHSAQLSDRVEAVPPHPSRTGPAGPARDGFRAVGRKGGGHLIGPGCPRPAGGQRADHGTPLACSLFSAVTGVRQGGPEADRGYPVSTAESACFRHGGPWSASPGCLPRRRSGTAGDRVWGRGMCPSGKLAPHRLPHSHNRRPGRSRCGKHRPSVAGAPAAHRGSTPRYRAGQGPLPGASTGVEAPRYPPSGAAVPVAGGNRRRRRARSHLVECKP